MEFKSILLAAILLLTGCDSILDMNDISNSDREHMNYLSIESITTQNTTKALIEDDYLPDGSEIGVTVLSRSGAAYDGIDYQNIRFVATGSGVTQTWAGAETVYLSATEGVCYGYYPYSSSVTDITEIPVSTAGQTDYLYATPVAVDINNRNVSLSMNHGLSAVRFALKRGTYTGTGVISAVSVTSGGLGTAGSLNALTGKLSGVTGIGTEIGVSAAIELSSAEQNADVIVVPTGISAALMLSVTVDGKVYSTAADARIIAQGKCYTYTMTINAGELALSGVKVGDWGYDDAGAPVIDAAGYKVSFAGDYNDISFSNHVEGNTVTIKACGVTNCSKPRAVTTSGGTLSQSIDGYVRTITLSNITSDVTVTFNGTAIPLYWKGVSDGIYAISKDYTPVTLENATTDCIGVALINSFTGQKLMIEKNEQLNASYQKAFTDCGATGTGYYQFYWGVHGSTMNYLLGILDYSLYTKANSIYTWGYIPDKDGNYSSDRSSNNFLGLPDSWPTDPTQYLLADTTGYQMSRYLMQVTATDSNNEYPKMGQLLKTFLDSDDALGYDDWFIPGCGQFALIKVYLSDINAILNAIGGQLIGIIDEIWCDQYWCTSEYNSDIGWHISLSNGCVSNNIVDSLKKHGKRVRLIRYLN